MLKLEKKEEETFLVDICFITNCIKMGCSKQHWINFDLKQNYWIEQHLKSLF